jgi:hypothetical protein
VPAGTGKCIEGIVFDNIELKREGPCFKGRQKIMSQIINVLDGKGIRNQIILVADLKEKSLPHFPFILYGKGMGF